jgi:CBS-domain-containing membrane protein
VRPLDIYTRKRITRSGAENITRFVRCPDGRWLPLAACHHCESCGEFTAPATEDGEWIITCSKGEEEALTEDGATLSALAARTPVTAVMDHRVLCVNDDVPVAMLAQRLVDEGTGVAIVLARDGRALGVLSGVDLAGPPADRLARAVMTPFMVTLLDGAMVADAIPLIVERRLEHVPILSASSVLGVVSARAIVRWITQNVA